MVSSLCDAERTSMSPSPSTSTSMVMATLTSSQHRRATIPLRGTKTMAQQIRHGLLKTSTPQQTALTMYLLRMLTATAISTLSQHQRAMAPSHGTKTTVLRIHLGHLLPSLPMRAVHVAFTLLIWTVMATLTLFQHRLLTIPLHGTRPIGPRLQMLL